MSLNRNTIIALGITAGVLVVGLLLYLALGALTPPASNKSVTLQMWGVFDDTSLYQDAIQQFNRLNPNINIIYREFNYADYEKTLVNSFAAGTGPDIFLMHNTWLAKHKDLMQPLPQKIAGQSTPLMTIKQFQDQFVDVAYDDLVSGSDIYGLPLYVDTLALYYNKDIFNSAGITTPPKTYDDLNNDVTKLTTLDSQGNIQRSAIAMGTAKNINRSTDVLMELMLQSGVKMTSGDNGTATFSQSVNGQNVGETALQYYTDFANPSKQVYTWNPQQHYSIDAFTNGETAMMFNYSHHIATIRSKSARFNFGTALMPQISGAPLAVNYADYWAPTVSKQSKSAIQAWTFLVYLTSAKGAVPYVNASNRPSARRDLIEQQKNDPDLGVFANQALSARSWYQRDDMAIETIFGAMIDDINFGRASIRDALQSAENKVTILMRN